MKKTVFLPILITLIISLLLPSVAAANEPLLVEYFYSETCPDCARTTPIIDEIEKEYGERIVVERIEVSSSVENWDRWYSYGFEEIPSVVVNNETKIPKERITKEKLEEVINIYLSGGKPEEPFVYNKTTIATPFGRINVSNLSLPLLAVVLGAVDSFNPCSFFILLFLLSLLIYVKSRKRMLLVGSIFVFFSGLIYFLFMSALLNVFILTSHVKIVTIVAAVFALILGGLNIKDFFSSRGVSVGIPKEKRFKLFRKMRKIVREPYLPSVIAGTVVLAISANTYELFCTIGFPMVFTKILALHKLNPINYYMYILLYNIVYVIPLVVIVAIFTLSLGRMKLTEEQGKTLKLISGDMMFLLGAILLFNPGLMSDIITALALIATAIVATLVIIFLTKLYQKIKEQGS